MGVDNVVEAYVDSFMDAVPYLLSAPPARLEVGPGRLVFRWLGIGRRYLHPVEVRAYPGPRQSLVLVAVPDYPLYALAAAAAMTLVGWRFAAAVRARGAVAVYMVGSRVEALRLARRVGEKMVLVNPAELVAQASFHGALRRTPAGYVCTGEEVGPVVDNVVTHWEELAYEKKLCRVLHMDEAAEEVATAVLRYADATSL